jgi:3-oxoadipate enol-lactonase
VDERRVPTALGEVRVQVDGAGPAMLFWPSLLMTGDMWAGQAAHFAGRHRVILVDPPGHGGSSPLRSGFTFAQCAEVVVDILDALQVDTVHLVGNSWGGMIGGTFAALHPSRIDSAVLMNSTGSPSGRRQRLEYGALLAGARLLGGLRPPLTRSALKAFLGPTTFRTRPEVVAEVRRSVESVDISSGAWAVRSVVPRRPDQLALFETIRAPVLVVAGAEDATFPVLETRAMADAIPGSRFVVLDGVAHLAALEDPALVSSLIEEFVASLSPER